MVTTWLHVETTVIDPWVLPIWNAVHRAVQEGRTTRPGDAAGQLALHLSTRLAMLPVIFRRLNEGMEQLKAVLAGRESLHEWTTEREGYVFPIPQDLQYGLLVDLDALLFELKACRLHENDIHRAAAPDNGAHQEYERSPSNRGNPSPALWLATCPDCESGLCPLERTFNSYYRLSRWDPWSLHDR